MRYAQKQSPSNTKQHEAERVERAKANGQPNKNGASLGNSKYGLFAKPAATNQEQAMLDAASYLEHEKPKSISFHPKHTVGNMIKHAAGNFLKNTIVTEATPLVKPMIDLAEKNLTIAPLVIGGAELVTGYGVASVATQSMASNALLSSISSAYGSASTGGDRWSILSAASIGATSSLLSKSKGMIGVVFNNPYMASVASNISGQFVSLVRNSDDFHPSLISPLFSLFGTSLAKQQTELLSLAIKEYPQAPFIMDVVKNMQGGMTKATTGGIGKELSRRYQW